MSFELELRATVGDWEIVERLAEAMRGDDMVALVPGRRRRWFRAVPPAVHLDWEQGAGDRG